LRQKLYWWDEIRDDNAIEPYFDINWVYDGGHFGVHIPFHQGDNRGSYVWEPPIKNLETAFDVLQHRKLAVDVAGTERKTEIAEHAFGDLLPTRRHSFFYWTLGMTWKIIDLIGIEPLMIAMIDEPEWVHRLMAWMRDEHLEFLEQITPYLTPQNKDQYTGSGGVAYTEELSSDIPTPLWDHWGFAESQETVGVSPAMFAEFILPYQIPLLDRFGLNCYGCCEPVHLRWESIKQIPRLRRVSVSPWCDLEIMANELQRNYVYSRKPNPAPISVGFDEKTILEDLKHTMDVAGKCVLELILKDTHTVEGDPSRLGRWVRMALDAVNR
jgi:hypothetical protein